MQILKLSQNLHKFSLVFVLTFGLSIFGTDHSSALGNGPTFKSLSTGEYFTCGITDEGDLYCWGDNERSQLGTAAINASTTPNKVFGVSNAVEVATGKDFACVRLKDGRVSCWGRADLGQTADGRLSLEDRYFPVPAQGITSAVGLVAGESHACALILNGEVLCWGANQFGQVNYKQESIQRFPVKVLGIPAIKQISSGSNHTCALDNDGFAHCWGDNRFGQLGIGSNQVLVSSAKPVLGAKGFTKIRMGFNTSCAFASKGQIWCWGNGIEGQSGTADRTNRWLPEELTAIMTTTVITANNPTIVVNAVDMQEISIGKTVICGIANSTRLNSLYCWGGVRSTDPGISNSVSYFAVDSVSVGAGHGCVISTVGTLACWGWNHKGQLGLSLASNTFGSILMVSGFPDWIHWISSWSLKVDDELGLLTWTGGSGTYVVSLEGLGIVCEGRSTLSCKFGPLESNKSYRGVIYTRNLDPALNRSINVNFTTKEITSAFNANQEDKKADEFLKNLSKQIEASEITITNAIKTLDASNLEQEGKIAKLNKINQINADQEQLVRRKLQELVIKIKTILKQ